MPETRRKLASIWSSLPADCVSSIFALLSAKQLGAARLVCTSWNMRILVGVKHITARSARAVEYCQQLSNLTSICTINVFSTRLLCPITGLKKVTIWCADMLVLI